MDALPFVLDWLTPRLGAGPLIVGLSGPQGSGKSTLAARVVERWAEGDRRGARFAPRVPAAGGSAAAVSLDDFYLPKARRQALARTVHPLLATRGVPGTHDLPLLLEVLQRVRSGRPVCLPVFDKLADDRRPPQHWRRFDRIDLLILEGWCVGARPQPHGALATPINLLEAREDRAARWRTHANQALAGTYQRAWAMLDALAFLAAPDWETVPRWRAGQEAGLTRASGRKGMVPAALARFCAHYERLTRWQRVDTPRHAGLFLQLNEQRQVVTSSKRNAC